MVSYCINQSEIWSQRIGHPYVLNGTITNLKINSGVKIPFWRKIWWNADKPTGTTVKFRARTAKTESDLSTAVWSAYYTVSGSTIVTSGCQWLEVEMRLETTNPNVTPVVHDFTVEYSNTR